MTGGGDAARENRPELLPSELPRSGATATEVPGLTLPAEATTDAMSM